MRNLLKIRYVSIILLTLFWIAFGFQTFIFGGGYSLNLFIIAVLFVGSILFTLNKRLSDYVSFSIFIFGVVSLITYNFLSCKNYEVLTSEPCLNFIRWNLFNNKIETSWLLLSIIILGILTMSFGCNKNINNK